MEDECFRPFIGSDKTFRKVVTNLIFLKGQFGVNRSFTLLNSSEIGLIRSIDKVKEMYAYVCVRVIVEFGANESEYFFKLRVDFRR